MSNLSYDFKGKVAFVTGAGGGGTGTEIVKQLLKAGASVGMTVKSEDSIDYLNNELRIFSGYYEVFICNAGSESSTQKAMNTVVERFGTIDILVNNAAAGVPFKYAENISSKDWDTDISTILMGSFYSCKYAIPHMKRNKFGKIIFISSSSAIKGSWGRAITYSASKSALTGMVKQLALEMAQFGININMITPSQIDTPRVKRGGRRTSDSIVKYCEKNVPLGRPATPFDVSSAVMFLSSKESSYITGQNLIIDGGQSLSGPNKLI
ncbi:SDR family NAD(P)-dependent oxidoreductase [Microbulbifer sp. ANSA001]|uniref:SDR family NAD(P)-dependent oxidoreductase n=1 Tax=Microbulbifer sp. ANSA001 TaxID=3243358 RepID=UPI0040419E48